MTSLSFILSFALVAVLLAAWWREQRWRNSVRKITTAAGLHVFEADKLAALFAGLQKSSQDLAKEEYLRRLFESLLNEIRQGVVIVDDSMRIKFCNRTMAQLLHKSTIHRGRTLLEELQDHQITNTVQSAIQKQRRCVAQIEIASSQGNGNLTNHYYLVEAAPLPAKAERGAWLMMHDITEQTMTEQIRKDFVANASHELRTPLTLINGYVETLQSGVIKDASGLKRCLDVMEKHGKRILRIVEDMLTISKLEVGYSALNIEPFAVRSCVQDVLDHLGPVFGNRDIKVELDFPADGGQMRADRFYWDQIFTNLIENSVKENPDSGLEIAVSGRWFADHCLIKVSDNGIGIPAHDVPFVFKRFYRAHKHHSPQIKGTGLGLSIVRRAVEAHGGIIDLISIPGKETTFTMRVPLTARDQVDGERAA